MANNNCPELVNQQEVTKYFKKKQFIMNKKGLRTLVLKRNQIGDNFA